MIAKIFSNQFLLAIGIMAVIGPTVARAELPLPYDHLSEKTLREPNPFSFISLNSDVNLEAEDFYVENMPNAKWIPGSLQWVRVGNGKDEGGILVPRARLLLAAENGSEGGRDAGKEIEVALTQVDNPIKVRFKPRSTVKTHFYFDSSCSPYNLRVNDIKLDHSWVMVSCHRLNNEGEKGTKQVISTTVIFEGEQGGQLINVNLDSDHPKQTFTNGSDSVEISASVGPVFHHLGFSLGVGAYSNRNEEKAFATLYGSYFLNDALKIAAFGAMPIRTNPEMDLGGYLVMEEFRGVDERISLNLLLGAHLLSYVSSNGVRTNSFGGPQGVELTFRDLFIRNENFSFGGFFYPNINGQSYLNTWARYGSNQIFFELNFIEWQEPDPYFYSKSFGVSVGFPLFRAL